MWPGLFLMNMMIQVLKRLKDDRNNIYNENIIYNDNIIHYNNFPAAENITAHLYEDMSVARMVVYFHSFTYEHVKAIKKYDEIRVLSNIGGINGMYLGLSFYLLFQACTRCNYMFGYTNGR